MRTNQRLANSRFWRNLAVAGAFALIASSAEAAVTYTYDALGRLSTATYDDGKQIVYTYDAAGNRTATAIAASAANRPPIATNDLLTAPGTTPTSFDPRTNDSDPDGDALTITSVTTPVHGTASVGGSGTSVTYTSVLAFIGTDSFSYTISDGHGNSTVGVVSVTVTQGPNHSPTAVNDTASTSLNTLVETYVLANDSDPDGDPLSVTSVTAPAHGTAYVSGLNTTTTYTPAANYGGADSYTYSISDGRGGTATATVNVTVVTPNRPPVAVNDSFIADVATATTFDPRTNDTDPDGGDTKTVTAVTTPAHGTATVGSGGTSVVYTGNAGYSGTDAFQYTINDSQGASATAVIAVSVGGPTAVADIMSITANVGTKPPKTIDPRINDITPNLTITAKTNGTLGTVAITGGGTTVTYSKTTNITIDQDDSFTYTIKDSSNRTSVGTVTVHIHAIDNGGN